MTLLVVEDDLAGVLEVGRGAAVSLPDLAALAPAAAGLFQGDLRISPPQPIRVFGDETQQQFADGRVSDE